MLIVFSSKLKAIAFICLIFKIEKESQDKMKAKLSLLFILKFKSDTSTLLFNKIVLKKKNRKSFLLSERLYLLLKMLDIPSACLFPP